MVDVLCGEPCVWGVLCAGLTHQFSARISGLEDRACRWGEKSEGGSSMPWLHEVGAGGGWVRWWGNDMEIRMDGD